jgi:hypothetical protein
MAHISDILKTHAFVQTLIMQIIYINRTKDSLFLNHVILIRSSKMFQVEIINFNYIYILCHVPVF